MAATKKAPSKKPKPKPASRADRVRNAIRNAMAEQDHDIQTTAAGAGMHRSTLGRWMSGTREMTAGQLFDVLDYLGIKAI